MLRNKKGSLAAVGVGMTLFIVGVVALFISIFITAELGDAVNTSIADGSDLETIYNSAASMTYSGIKIMGIAMIIIGAIVVMNGVKSL